MKGSKILGHWPAGPRATPPLEALRVFEVAVRNGGFAKAAAELHLTPNAVAHQVAKLEDWFGFPLFRRHPRGVSVSPEVKRFADDLARLLREVSSVSGQFAEHMSSSAITISAMPSLVTKWLLPILGELRRAQPDISFRVMATPSLTDFAREDVDLAIREGVGPWAGLSSEFLMPEWWAPVCSPGLAGALDVKRPEDLARADVLHDEPWSGTPKQIMWHDWCRAHGLAEDTGREHLTFSHSYLSVEAAIAGQGIALGNLTLVADDIRSGRLLAPVGRWIRGPYSFHIAAPEDIELGTAAIEARNWIVDSAQRYRARMDGLRATPA